MSKIRDSIEHNRLQSQVGENYGEFRPTVEALRGSEIRYYYDKDGDNLGNPLIGQPYRSIVDRFDEGGVQYERSVYSYTDDFKLSGTSTEYDNATRRRVATIVLDGDNNDEVDSITYTDDEYATSWGALPISQGWTLPEVVVEFVQPKNSEYLRVIEFLSPEMVTDGGKVTLDPGIYDVYCIGGGGGGGGLNVGGASWEDGGGGGGGACSLTRITINTSTEYNISIGLKGAGGKTVDGGDGTITSFKTLGNATLGQAAGGRGGGRGGEEASRVGEMGLGGVGGVGDIVWDGGVSISHQHMLPLRSTPGFLAGKGGPAGGPFGGQNAGDRSYIQPYEYEVFKGAGGNGKDTNGVIAQDGAYGVIIIVGV